jgi:carboxyl-terminal processing protease
MTGQSVVRRGVQWAVLAVAAALLASCGGNGSSTSQSSALANHCAAPRPGLDVKGTAADEKNWLRAWTNELYLWYSEVPNADPAAYATPQLYFDVLKTTQPTPSGNKKDRFHFWIPTDVWQAESQSGVQVGYGGIQWTVVAGTPPREIRVAYIDPAVPTQAGLARGAKVLTVDNVDVVAGDPAVLNAGLFPAGANESHTFSVLDAGASTPRPVTLTSSAVQTTSVVNAAPIAGTTVGYMQFNDHNATAEAQLIQAIASLKQAGVTELVIDMRYNGGGYLAVASELAYMVAGGTRTSGKTFEKLAFNDKYPTTDPVTGQPLTPQPFLGTAAGLATVPRGQVLPSLGLGRVFVLTGPGTCSASESVINSLRGVDLQVIQIGAHTCGKPYGFYPADNCGTTYFSIEFKGVNAKGFGDYGDNGFTPGGTDAAGVPGCLVRDDFAHALGDPAEERLAAALQYAAGQPCPPPSAQARPATSLSAAASEAIVAKPPWRENRILSR